MNYNLLFLFAIIFIVYLHNYKENFNCLNCNRNSVWSNPHSRIEYLCRSCENCGVCIDKYGNRRCKIGNSKGPLFSEDCYNWIHGNNFYPYRLYTWFFY